MIRINKNDVSVNKFPDGTLLLKEKIPVECREKNQRAVITWLFENNEELVTLIYLAGHLRAHGITELALDMPYIPNARQDRVKTEEDVFTLKYFAQVINWLSFASVTVLDPHSSVSEALIDRICVKTPEPFVRKAIDRIGGVENLTTENTPGSPSGAGSGSPGPYPPTRSGDTACRILSQKGSLSPPPPAAPPATPGACAVSRESLGDG